MRSNLFVQGGLLLAMAADVGSCSTATPDFHGPLEAPKYQWLSEQHLINHIQCQLAGAVHDAVHFDKENASRVPENLRAKWLNGWGAKVSLALSVNTKDNFSPGVTFNHPLENAVTVFSKNGNVNTSQNRSVGLGFTWSADATRTETIGFFYSFADLLASPIDATKCTQSEGPYLSSDLKISDFLEKGLDISFQPGVINRKPGDTPYQTFTYEVKFIVTTSGSVTPAWKLVQLSANQSGNLYLASRINTDDLTITMGKVTTDTSGKASATNELDQQHLANLIGQAVANSLQNRPQP